MKITKLEIGLLILGPVILRPVIPNDGQYFLACFFYGMMLGIGKLVLEDLDKNE